MRQAAPALGFAADPKLCAASEIVNRQLRFGHGPTGIA